MLAEAAEHGLPSFAETRDGHDPAISRAWTEQWERIVHIFVCPHEIRGVVYTTNASEFMNRSLHKVLATPGTLPGDEAVCKRSARPSRSHSRKRAYEWHTKVLYLSKEALSMWVPSALLWLPFGGRKRF